MAKIKLNELTEKLSPEEQEEINALENRIIEYDEDSPEMSLEQLKQFHRMDRNKQTVSIRLSPQTLNKAKSLGKGYTSILSRLIDLAINDEDMLKKCL